MAKKTKFYAVAIGRSKDGEILYGQIYNNWPDCEAVVRGVSAARYKGGFGTELEAINWMIPILKNSGVDISNLQQYREALNASSLGILKTHPKPKPVGDLQVSPLKKIQTDIQLTKANTDIQFDITCHRLGISPDTVMTHLKSQFVNTIALLDEPEF